MEIVTSHADADGVMVRALGPRHLISSGVVVAATGHGTINEPLRQALQQLSLVGITVAQFARGPRRGSAP